MIPVNAATQKHKVYLTQLDCPIKGFANHDVKHKQLNECAPKVN